MGEYMDVAVIEDEVPAKNQKKEKDRKEDTHQQDFLLVFPMKSLRNLHLIYIQEEDVIGKEESHCWIQPGLKNLNQSRNQL